MSKYKVVNGTSYHTETPDKVIKILEQAREHGFKLRLFYGDTKTGRDWLEEYDTIGTISRSTGENKVPLLIKTKRSTGGGALLDHCIVRIDQGNAPGASLYKHTEYKLPEITIKEARTEENLLGYTHSAWINGKIHANFKSLEKTAHWVDFIRGKRNSK